MLMKNERVSINHTIIDRIIKLLSKSDPFSKLKFYFQKLMYENHFNTFSNVSSRVFDRRIAIHV